MSGKIVLILAVFAGGAAGTLLRYGINLYTVTWLFPAGTLIENLAGSFLLGMLVGWVAVKAVPAVLKEGVGAGFCGGFTTMSTLAADTVFLTVEVSMIQAAVYVITSLTGGMALAFGGLAAGGKLAGRRMKAGGEI